MKRIVMIGTAFDTMGGIASVVGVYRQGGLFARWPVTYLATHRDGGAAAKLGALVPAWLRFVGMLVAGRVGLLHVHISSRASTWRKMLFLWPAYAFGVPVILHLHGSEFAIFHDRECGPRRQRLIRAAFERASRVVVLSQTWAAWMRGMAPRARVTAIYNPVLLPPAVPWTSRSAMEVLFLGRLGKRKGAYDLVAAFARADVPAARLRMGGDGEIDAVRAEAAERGIEDRVVFLGWVRGGEKDALLARAGLYALPSYNEGLPMGLLEAMAAGLPVVTCPIGGIPEAVDDGVEGFLVQPGDIGALADRLRRLLADPALAGRMGAAGRARVERCFSADVILPQVEALYAELARR